MVASGCVVNTTARLLLELDELLLERRLLELLLELRELLLDDREDDEEDRLRELDDEEITKSKSTWSVSSTRFTAPVELLEELLLELREDELDDEEEEEEEELLRDELELLELELNSNLI